MAEKAFKRKEIIIASIKEYLNDFKEL